MPLKLHAIRPHSPNPAWRDLRDMATELLKQWMIEQGGTVYIMRAGQETVKIIDRRGQ
jgi:hypothetical protein